MKIKVLYEDANILAIDKPAGVLTHPDARAQGETVYDIFKKKFPKLEVVHRLDRETSGVMLLAKNAKAHEFLKKQFSTRTIKKIYLAIVNGDIKNDRGVINKPIGRSPKDFRRRLAGRGARGEMREAVTEYKVVKRFEAPGLANSLRLRPSAIPKKKTVGPSATKNLRAFTLLEVRPRTGRTHQIRVHMKYLNHPIVGDELYNRDGTAPKGWKRMALHAKSIEFTNLKGDIIKVESKVPKEFEKYGN